MAFSIVQKFVRLFSQQNYDDVQIKMTSIFNGTTNCMSRLYTASPHFPVRYRYLISLQLVP